MSIRGMAGVTGEKDVPGVEMPPLVLVVPAEVRFIMRDDEKPLMGDLMLEEPEVREDLDCEVERMRGEWLESTMGLGAFSRREKRPMVFVVCFSCLRLYACLRHRCGCRLPVEV